MSDVDGRDLDGFSDAARRAVAAAEAEAIELGHDLLGTEHLLLGVMVDSPEVSEILGRNGGTLAAARRKVAEARPPAASAGRRRRTSSLDTTPRAARSLVRSVRFAHQAKSHEVGCAHLLLAVIDVEGTGALVLRGLGVDLDRLRTELVSGPTPSSVAGGDESTAAAVVVDAPAPLCPACSAELADAIHAHTTHATDAAGASHHVTVFACASCGYALGVTSA